MSGPFPSKVGQQTAWFESHGRMPCWIAAEYIGEGYTVCEAGPTEEEARAALDARRHAFPCMLAERRSRLDAEGLAWVEQVALRERTAAVDAAN